MMLPNYIKNAKLNLYIRSGFSGIAYSDGDEIERRMLDVVSSVQDRSTYSPELDLRIVDWPSEYHFSRQRHCLIRPLGIQAGDKVLEIGCGCGAISRFLGEIGAQVTAVEGGLMRAHIAANRCADLPNVRILSEDLTKLELNETFDWILLVGVLEYATTFSDAPEPARHYIESLSRYLAPAGRLVVAIENKLGLKYFNACGEDHLGVPFVGIQGLYGPGQPCTYGRKELSDLLFVSGFAQAEYLYPFPDYKLPRVILTESGLKEPQFAPEELLANMYARDYGNNHYRLFNEPMVMRELVHNNLLGEMSHSLLVVANRDRGRSSPSDVLALCYSANRAAAFATETRIVKNEGKIYAIKKKLVYPKTIVEAKLETSRFHQILGKSNYISGRLSVWRLIEARSRRAGMDEIVQALMPWFEYLLSLSNGSGGCLANYVIDGRFLDLTPINLIESESGFEAIDQEWKIDDTIPLGWVAARAVIVCLYYQPGFENSTLSVFNVIKAMCDRKGLSVTDVDFKEWVDKESALQTIVTGHNVHFEPNMFMSQRIIPLSVIVLLQEKKLSSLNHRIEDRDGQIVGLTQAMAERDGQIVGLTQAMAERDGQIVGLTQAVADRDGQIAGLTQAVAERDRQYAGLNQTMRDRDASYQQTIDHILNSNSWRLTSPIRYIGTRWKRFRHIVKSLRSKFNVGKAVRVYKNEGLTAFRRILPVIHPTTPASSIASKSNPAIPRIIFDETSNGFVAYQKNPPINPVVKLIAFYLPQFHPCPENDQWWGKGFTEWTNVGKALPIFDGHYQPHCPIHFGYYDLRVPEVMQEQALLAKEYGVYGFSYYFYWFDGKILLDTPLEMMLSNKKVDIPFCFTWANENWTRRWDGQENDVLIGQNHRTDDSLAFIRHLVKYFKDDRYIRIDGKPILVIYRADIIPNMAATAKIWRDELLKHGIPGLYLMAAQTFGIRSPEVFDFNAAVEFPPHTIVSAEINSEVTLVDPEFDGYIYSYEQVVANSILSEEPEYKLFRTAMLSWDNTARKSSSSHIFHEFSLLRYKQWLSSIVNKVHANPKYTGDEKIVFVNAWNEWAEGTHLEPDQKFGYGYLQTTYDVLQNYDCFKLPKPKRTLSPVKQSDYAVILHLHYDELWPNICDYLMKSSSDYSFDLYVSVTSSVAAEKVLKYYPDAYIELVENRGRDILPFIRMLKFIKHLDYKAVCKIHSKRSKYRKDGDKIRDEILGALMGSKEQVEEILSRFKNNEQLGMVVPKNYLIEHNDHNMTFDKEVVDRISRNMQINFRYDIFPAGSMFWFAPKSLEPLLSIGDSLFEIESGAADGTCAHGVERMFCQIVKDRGCTIESC